MGFGDLQTDDGLQALNEYLADKSYIEGYVPSQSDVVVFNAVGSSPSPKYVNALRWYNQIVSYNNDEKLAFPGVQKPIEEYRSQTSGGGGATGGGGGGDEDEDDDDDDDDDDFELFGSDDEEEKEEAERIKQERLKQYAEKKAKKAPVIAKSNIIMEVKPWDDETDMNDIEAHVRSIATDGLVWGASKLVPVGYGIKKLVISCVVEDDKVGTDFLEENITANEVLVQSVDILAFNKV